MRSVILFFITSGVALSGCTRAKVQAASDKPSENIFSNRPITAMPDLTVVTFKSPALLQVATKTKRGWVIPANAKAQVLADHTGFEKKLKSVAPDAQIVYRYNLVLNGEAIFTSSDITAQLKGMPEVKDVQPAVTFDRPQDLNVSPSLSPAGAVNSVNFIGADEAHKLGFTGKGVRVGVIDTGIDYTHAMLGGSGSAAEYAAIDPSQPNPAFPNKKVVGGIDLAGTTFDPSNPVLAMHLPHPDANPLDEAGHGSHVAGTIAGVGDGVTTYDGVAPDAQLYAIKVFGKTGSTADATVIAAFEYAADPSGKLDPNDQLDVVNLSLGGNFGQPHVLYNEAVQNLSNAGTVVVCAAGNSGAVDYIVGSPSTSDDAISVAASVDGSNLNWKFPASKLSFPDGSAMIVKAIEGPVSQPIAKLGAVSGQLVDIGDASTDLDDATKAKLAGKVALIVRGKVPFAVKAHRAADAGAIGIVVYNNAPGEPIPMGGDGKPVAIPAIMITQEIGLKAQQALKTGAVSIDFKTGQIIQEPENIDTITDFSSKGPRSEDNLIKPEVAAPGLNIISAGMGTGNQAAKMDGTSMATPHMTGAIALLKQAHPDLTSLEFKSLVMNTAKVLSSKGAEIPITLQGAGRVQIQQAITSPVVSETPSISLGRVQLEDKKVLEHTITLRNLTDQDLDLQTSVEGTGGLTVTVPAQIHIPARGKVDVDARFDITLQDPTQFTDELDGRIFFKNGNQTVLQIPALAIRTEASQIVANGSGTSFKLSNGSQVPGIALAFNLLGEEPPKSYPDSSQSWMNRDCDLQSAGYRILHKNGGDVVQFAFKLYKPVTTWVLCDVSVLIDADGDGVADQEIAGVTGMGLEGVAQSNFTTVVLDAAQARAIRLAYEQTLGTGTPGQLDYSPAVMAISQMAPFPQSTLAVIEAPLSKLTGDKNGKLNIKLASEAEGGQTFQPDKYIGGPLGKWIEISPKASDQSYFGMDEVTAVPASGANLTLSKGAGNEDLVIYYPLNQIQPKGVDGQEQIIR